MLFESLASAWNTLFTKSIYLASQFWEDPESITSSSPSSQQITPYMTDKSVLSKTELVNNASGHQSHDLLSYRQQHYYIHALNNGDLQHFLHFITAH